MERECQQNDSLADGAPASVAAPVDHSVLSRWDRVFCRTPLELKRRVETLVRTIEKELEEPLRKDKEKRSSTNSSLEYGDGAGSKRKSSAGDGGSRKKGRK